MTEQTTIDAPTTEKAPAKKAPNLTGLARTAIPNESKVFIREVGEPSEKGGIKSFRVLVAKVSEDGEVSLRDVTKTLRSVPGADFKGRGRPRSEAVVRLDPSAKGAAKTALARQIATALYGEQGKINAQMI